MGLQAIAQLLGSFGEFAGAIAVFATLVYLARQVAQNNRQLQAERRNKVQDQQQVLRMTVAANPEVAALWVRGLTDPNAMDNVEKARFDALMGQFIWQSCQIYEGFQHDDDGTWGIAMKGGLASVLSTPGGRRWWGVRQSAYVPKFVERVNLLLEEASTSNRPASWLGPESQ